ncbi:MAG: hypothetical protein U0M21_02700 [Emergencia sp.]|nr:hypothetical protein [Emergencia sp.]
MGKRRGEAEMTEVLYFLYLIGVAVWQYPVLYGVGIALRNRLMIRRNLRRLTARQKKKKYKSLDHYMRQLIDGAEAERWISAPEILYILTGISGVSAVLIGSFLGNFSMALLCGGFTAAMPYCILLVRLHERRVARSREGDVLVQELLNNYKIYDCNMKEAIEVTAVSLEDAPNGKRLLLHLSKGLQTAVSKDEVERLLYGFRYALDTAWGNVLAANIFFAYMYGIHVDAALEDLLASMTRSREVVEYGKRENNEARMILWYLTPISYVLSIVAACRYFGFTLTKFIQYQWGTALGLRWFILIMMLYSTGILLNGFFSKEKMDI